VLIVLPNLKGPARTASARILFYRLLRFSYGRDISFLLSSFYHDAPDFFRFFFSSFAIFFAQGRSVHQRERIYDSSFLAVARYRPPTASKLRYSLLDLHLSHNSFPRLAAYGAVTWCNDDDVKCGRHVSIRCDAIDFHERRIVWRTGSENNFGLRGGSAAKRKGVRRSRGFSGGPWTPSRPPG